MNLPVILILISLLEAGILVAAPADAHDTAGHAGNKATSNNNQGWMGKISGVFGTGVKAVKDTVNPLIAQANSLYTTPYIRIMLVCNYEGDSDKEGVQKEKPQEEKKEAYVVLFNGELNDKPAWGLPGGFAPMDHDDKPVSNPVAQLIQNDSNGALKLMHAENEQHALKDFSYTLTNKGLAVIPVANHQGTLTATDFKQLAESMSKNEKKTIKGIGVAKFEDVISGKPITLVLGYDWKNGKLTDIKDKIQLAATMSWGVWGLNRKGGVQATVEKALQNAGQHGTAANTPIVQLSKAKTDH